MAPKMSAYAPSAAGPSSTNALPAPAPMPGQLSALHNRVAPNGPPQGHHPAGKLGANFPNPLPEGRPTLKKATHIDPKASNTGRGYGVLQSDTPNSHAIPPLDTDISIVEICNFFPNWLTIPDVIVRAHKNGWTRKRLAKAQLHARDMLTMTNLNQVETKIQKQISEGGNMYLRLAANDPWSGVAKMNKMPKQDSQTANTWELRPSYTGTASDMQGWGHVPLSQAYKGVVNWPQESDSKVLTRCLQFAAINEELELDTSHWNLIVHHLGLQLRVEDGEAEDMKAADDLDANVANPTT